MLFSTTLVSASFTCSIFISVAPIKYENVPLFPVPWLLALFVVPFMVAPPFVFYAAILNRGKEVGHPENY